MSRTSAPGRRARAPASARPLDRRTDEPAKGIGDIRLADGLSFCEKDGVFIFLDIPGDRYFHLPPTLGQAFSRLRADRTCDEAAPALQDAIDLLICAGIITHDAGVPRHTGDDGPLAACAAPGIVAAFPADAQSSGMRHMAGALLNHMRLAHALKHRSLASILHRLAHDRSHRRGPFRSVRDAENLPAILQAHHRLGALTGTHDVCLLRSLALARHLIGAGFAPMLVFGVATRPFRAHCWLQLDGQLLNDTLEHVACFTPVHTA